MASSDPLSLLQRLSGEDLSFWWLDTPTQPTTMAMLMVLGSVPDPHRLRLALERAILAVPRLAQRVVEAPLDMTLPHWELDPTFDLDYHLRHEAVSGARDMDALWAQIGPIYEHPFDRSRPLWEAYVFEGLEPGGRAALFFKLHHAIADGVGANAIFAAMTSFTEDGDLHLEAPPAPPHRGSWAAEAPLGRRLFDALRDRIELDLHRAEAVAGAVVDTVRHPSNITHALDIIRSLSDAASFDSHTPLRGSTGRARQLQGLEIPFEEVRATRNQAGVSMIDVILTAMGRAMGRWHDHHGIEDVHELMTMVPIANRDPSQWHGRSSPGNVASSIMLKLPIRMPDPLQALQEVHQRMRVGKADPVSAATPQIAELLTILPRNLFTWMTETLFGHVDFIVTNVPGILMPCWLAGAAIEAAYPFAPVAKSSPASIALYGYRESLHIGVDSDCTTMADADRFHAMILEAFDELHLAVHRAA